MPPFDYWGPEQDPTTDEQREIRAFCEHILTRGGTYMDAYRVFNEQLNALHLRAAALVTICGVVVTVTGFSGRIIAQTSELAQFLIVSGLMFCLLAAAIAFLFVMPIRWGTSYMHLKPEEWLLTAIRRRNRKTRAFRFATFVLIIGLTLYGLAIAQMLLFPEETIIQIPAR